MRLTPLKIQQAHNGFTYTKGNIIHTINDGVYRVESIDAAGNILTEIFTAIRVEILSETLNKEYFETVDSTGNWYAFDSYENAIIFAKAREFALVRTAEWRGATWDGGIPMDSIDSANAKNGTYYIYKKSGDPRTEVAYFTLERLNAVIAEYAAESVSSYYWWQKTPAQSYNGNNLYSLTADRIFVGNSVTFAGHANYLIDGVLYSDFIYSAPGEHILTVYDNFGNSYDYTLIIVRTAPEIFYRLAEGTFNKAIDGRLYVFKEAITLKIEDTLDGDFAMYIIKNTLGEIVAIVSYGEEYTLSNSGRYTVQAINHGGLSLEVTFILSLNSPIISFVENADTKRLEVRIEPSADGSATLMEVRIYKSVDGGLMWILLEKDDYGRVINIDKLYYEFKLNGVYKVVVEDNFRSGIDAIIGLNDYQKPAPEGMLYGVEDGGYTNSNVYFTWTDEAKATVNFNGKTMAYIFGTELIEDGEYILTLYDDNGFEIIFTFTIKKTAPNIELSIKPVNEYLTESVTITFEKNCAAFLYLNDKLIGEFENGTIISKDGEYEIRVTDLAGNMTIIIFTLDTTPPACELIGVENGGSTSGAVTIRNLSESAAIEIYCNGNLINYSLNDSLTELGSYRIVLTDLAGNISEYTFEITYAVNTSGVVIILIVVFGIICGVVAVFILRKRGKFRTKK